MDNRKRIIRTYETTLQASVERVFPLLCPVREYDWIPQWQCDMLYSASGIAELGAVFATDFDDGFGRETWVVSRYEPPEAITFVRSGKRRTTRYEVVLQPVENGSNICWRQEMTGLDDRGDNLLKDFSQQKYDEFMVLLNTMLNHYLTTGQPMSVDLSKPRQMISRSEGE